MELTSSGLPVVSQETRKRVEEKFLSELLLGADDHLKLRRNCLMQRDELLYDLLSTRISATALAGPSRELSWIAVLGVYDMLDTQRILYKSSSLPLMTPQFIDSYNVGAKRRAQSQEYAQSSYGELITLLKAENPKVVEFIFDLGEKGQSDVMQASIGLTGLTLYELLHQKGLSNILDSK